MLDPRFHFAKKNQVKAKIVDDIIRYYYLEAPKFGKKKGCIAKTARSFSNLYHIQLKVDDVRYLVRRFKKYSNWRHKGRPEKDWDEKKQRESLWNIS